VAADSSSLNLADVDAGFDRIAQAAGKGSADEKQRLLKDLLARATRDEQRFLARLVMGELRQGRSKAWSRTPSRGPRRSAGGRPPRS